jgi:serine/threonine-protein kinase
VSHGQSPWKGVGTILAVTGDVVVIGNGSRESPAAGFSVLEEGATLKVGSNGHTRLVHDKEGATYEIQGPAVISVSRVSLSVEPASAIARRTTATIPAELAAPGAGPAPAQARARQVGGENLNNSRAGLVANSGVDSPTGVVSPAPAAEQHSSGSNLHYGPILVGLLVLLGLAAAIFKTSGSVRAALTILILPIGALGGWYILKPAPAPEARELMSALESAKNANDRLIQARQGEMLAQQALEEAKKAEDAAKASGDRAEQARLAAESAQRSAALQREADLVRQRDVDARSALKAAETLRPAIKSELAKSKVTAGMGAAERMAIREEEAARAAAGGKPDPGNTQVASAAPSATPSSGVPGAPALSLYEQGKAAENSGNIKGAVRLYVRAVRNGDFRAAKALGDIFAEGKGDVPKDYGESLRYYALAEKNGIEVQRANAR